MLLFEQKDDTQPTRVIRIDPLVQSYLPRLRVCARRQPGQLYATGFKAHSSRPADCGLVRRKFALMNMGAVLSLAGTTAARLPSAKVTIVLVAPAGFRYPDSSRVTVLAASLAVSHLVGHPNHGNLAAANKTSHGVKLSQPDWPLLFAHHGIFDVERRKEMFFLHLNLKARGEPLQFELPEAAKHGAGLRRWIDTAWIRR